MKKSRQNSSNALFLSVIFLIKLTIKTMKNLAERVKSVFFLSVVYLKFLNKTCTSNVFAEFLPNLLLLLVANCVYVPMYGSS